MRPKGRPKEGGGGRIVHGASLQSCLPAGQSQVTHLGHEACAAGRRGQQSTSLDVHSPADLFLKWRLGPAEEVDGGHSSSFFKRTLDVASIHHQGDSSYLWHYISNPRSRVSSLSGLKQCSPARENRLPLLGKSLECLVPVLSMHDPLVHGILNALVRPLHSLQRGPHGDRPALADLRG